MVLDPLAQIDVATIVAVAAIFLATFALLRRILFLPLIDVMERRAARVEAARSRKAEAERLLAEARERAERLLGAARDEAARIAEAAKSEALRERERSVGEAVAEADALLARGRADAAEARRSADEELEERVRACAGQALAEMVGRVDEGAVRYLVSRAVAARRGG